MYAVETGQSSIGGLDAILSNLPMVSVQVFIEGYLEFLLETILKIQMSCFTV